MTWQKCPRLNGTWRPLNRRQKEALVEIATGVRGAMENSRLHPLVTAGKGAQICAIFVSRGLVIHGQRRWVRYGWPGTDEAPSWWVEISAAVCRVLGGALAMNA